VLTEAAKTAIGRVFADTTVSHEDTLRELEDIEAELDLLLEDLRGDIE
jgi:hypothetical protein